MKRKPLYPLFLAGIGILTFSCNGGQQNKADTKTDDTVIVHIPDTAFYGHLGEGTGMSCLELITEEGDTMVLNKTDEDSGEDGVILGAVANYTDRFAIVTHNDNQSIKVALNMNELEQKWLSEGNPAQGFYLKPNGTAETLEQGRNPYGKWTLCNCRLVMHKNSEHTGENGTPNDTLDILELTPDSLVLQLVGSDTHTTYYHIR